MQLILVRHAQAGWGSSPHTGTDHARPLTQVGQRQAVQLGRELLFLAKQGIISAVELVLHSSAQRTTQTTQLLTLAADSIALCELYSGDGYELLEQVQIYGADKQSVLVVGHEPVISGTSFWLTEDARLNRGVATATAIVMSGNLGPGQMRLERLIQVPERDY